MEILAVIKDQFIKTYLLCKDFIKDIDPKTILAAAALLYFIFLRKWEFKKIFSFLLALSFFFVITVRSVYLLINTFGPETNSMLTISGRVIFLIIGTVIFIYYTALKD